MDAAKLTARVNELESRRDAALTCWRAAQARCHDHGLPRTTDLNEWREHVARTTDALHMLEELSMAGEHLTAAAELEQALKEENWGAVTVAARTLARFEPARPSPRYVIRYAGPEAIHPTYWVGLGIDSVTVKHEAATRYLDPVHAATSAPADWFEEDGSALFVIEEVTD
jgi:hypothetical protein